MDPTRLGWGRRRRSLSGPHRTLRAAEPSTAPPGPGHAVTKSAGHRARWSHGQRARDPSAHRPATRCRPPTAALPACGDPVRRPTWAGPRLPARGAGHRAFLGAPAPRCLPRRGRGPPVCRCPLSRQPPSSAPARRPHRPLCWEVPSLAACAQGSPDAGRGPHRLLLRAERLAPDPEGQDPSPLPRATSPGASAVRLPAPRENLLGRRGPRRRTPNTHLAPAAETAWRLEASTLSPV